MSYNGWVAKIWYAGSIASVLEGLKTSESGLSTDEAIRRLKTAGANVLPEAEAEGYLSIFIRQFKSPLIYILFAASLSVFLMGEPIDGSIILFILIFNAAVGTIQEGRAQNTLRALRHYVETNATALRSGKEVIIPDRDVVPGDVLILQEGEKIPADGRLTNVQNFKVDEAALTGESLPAFKVTDPSVGERLLPANQHNMVFKGTNILSGNGRMVVTETGAATIIGRIAKDISKIDTEMPLKANIRDLSRGIIAVVASISVAIFLLGLFRGESLTTMFGTVVSLAVSTIPEGLPIVITLVLVTGVWRMSKRNALVKKLQAVEALGQATVIATDKTGTLTKNELVIATVWSDGNLFDIEGVGYEPQGSVRLKGKEVSAANHPELLYMGKAAALCASARVSYVEEEKRWRVAGDPTEAALLVLGEKIGFKKDDLTQEAPFLAEIPFDHKLKYHATLYKVGGTPLLVLVGAPEVTLDLCTKHRVNGVEEKISAKDKAAYEEVFSRMSEKGQRVLALAVKSNVRRGSMAPEEVKGLTFVGFFGMRDALRPEVPDAIQSALSAGLKVVMITGDHRITARAIAEEAGIYTKGDAVLEGKDIDSMSDPELADALRGVSVFARVTPEHKLRIVQAYKRIGAVIAMTGDGVNDAPSLVAADLGVAMGKIGTEVAKEAGDIVLLDDNFASIVAAIEEGRNIYKTIKKVILYLFSTSVGEVCVIVGALLLGYPLPLLAAQIIWLNFVTDGFLDVALAMEPKEKGLLDGHFKKPGKYLIDKHMLVRMATMAIPMMIGTLYLFAGHFESDLPYALTLSLTTLAVFQWFNAWNCRSETESIFSTSPFTNKYLIGATAVVAFLQIAAVYTPLLQPILHTVPLNLSDWLVIIPIASTVVISEELRKYVYRRWFLQK